MKFFLHILSLFFILFLIYQPDKVFSQKNKKQLTASATPQDTIISKDDKILFFRHINEYAYYYNEAELLQIEQYLKKEETQKAYNALYNYVMKFGIKNFFKDTYLIWRLGKLAEKLGFKEKAKSFYVLVLKHHRSGNIKDFRLYYDSLNANDKDYYLPVEYYYTYANASSNVDTLDIPESVYTNVGDSVNSKYSDYAPALGGNDLIMVFTSQRNQKQSGMRVVSNEDLFYSRKADSLYITETDAGSRIDTLPWTRAKEMKGINTQYNEGSACFSRDSKIIYFSRCESPDGYGNCDIYSAIRQKNATWAKVKNLGLNVNGISWDSHPALSHSGDTLFFASDRLGGFGASDIYFTYKVDFDIDAEGDTTWIWAKAQNIGPEINTRYNEVSPFYHPKYEVLYFSSNGQLVNFGDFDIYKTYKSRGRWSEPKNIGPLVNYTGSEYYFTIDSKAQNLYYAKSKKDEPMNLDLHTATLPMEAQPEATVKFEGVVTDSITGKAFEGIVSIIDLDNGIEVAPKYLRPDGSYRFDLIRNNNYLVVITGEDFFRIERQFLLQGDTTLNIETPSIKFKKWQFTAIEFDESSADVTEEMKPDLNKLIIFLADNPQLGLKISGHTDSQGDEDNNMRLSQSRANSIKEYIINKGRFKENRIEATGYGNTKPIIAKEETEEDRRINRRVEFEIIKMQ